MKTVRFLLLAIIFSTLFSFGQKNETGLTINITNFRNNNGYVLIGLYKDGIGYPDEPEKAFRKTKQTIHNKSVTVSFTDIPSGNYSISFLHDENDDKKMNTNFFGLPKEGYGFSNNVMGTFGPPSLSKASFHYTVNERTIQSLRTRY